MRQVIFFVIKLLSSGNSLFAMWKLSKVSFVNICKILIKQNNEKVKKLKKNKVVNGNVKKYNKIAQMKINGKNDNEKLNKIKNIDSDDLLN